LSLHLIWKSPAIQEVLRSSGWSLAAVTIDDFPTVIHANLTDPDVAHSVRQAVVVQLNHQGVLNAGVDTARLLELYEPGYVISFGIAGSLDKVDAPIGSVLYATALIYYEPSKDISGNSEPMRLSTKKKRQSGHIQSRSKWARYEPSARQCNRQEM
jgi:nucleoside phosphorylase